MRRSALLPISFLATFSLGILACLPVDDDDDDGGDEDESAWAYFDRNIDDEAHDQLGEMVDQGIAEFAFHPEGGWVIVTEQGEKLAHDIPDECNEKLEEFLADGHAIQSIAFPPAGGDSWVIVTDRGKFARNIPTDANDKLEEFLAEDREVLSIDFPYEAATDNSWVIIARDAFYARNIDDEAYQMIRNFGQRPHPGADRTRPVYDIAFEPGGGWVILAEDEFFARNIDPEAFDKLLEWYDEARQIDTVAFDPDGNGWSLISGSQYETRPEDDEIERFEKNVAGTTLWERAREAGVPGVSVAVVVDNQVAWTAGYGHLAADDSDAVHPESLFQAASISKAVTSVGIHKLVDQGDILLTDDILDDLSVSVPARNCLSGDPPVILEDVLEHDSPINGNEATYPTNVCSGFTEDSDGGGYGGYHIDDPVPTLDEIIAGSAPASSEPITRSHPAGDPNYSGPGYTLLQRLIEDLTGQTFSNWMQTEVLDPTQMRDSFFDMTIPPSYYEDGLVASGHDDSGAVIPGERRLYPEFAAAGLYSTAPDLARLVIMLNDDGQFDGTQVLSQASRDSIALDGIGVSYNTSSITAANDTYSHTGTNAGFRSIWLGIPDADAGVVVMTNGSDAFEDQTFRLELAQAVVDAYGW